MVSKYIIYFLVVLMFCLCSGNGGKSEIVCTDGKCEGIYTGPEFFFGSDVAHQFSNKMCDRVGNQLKALYGTGKYVKVDFSKIIMSTEGMGSGYVIYKLTIPFTSVKDKCQAYTSFDHVGGWDHEPAVAGRKAQLKSALLKGETLDISQLLRTKEGLQEYWIQWKNKEVQAACENK